MKIKATYKGSHQEDDSLVLEFKINNWIFKRIRQLLQADNEYFVDVSEYKKNRTLEQNALLWELLTQIDKTVNGTRDPWDWYVFAIKKTGAKTKVIYMNDDSLDELKQMCLDKNGNIRAVEPLGKIDDLYAYRIFYGSSKFNTKEMSLLIDNVLDIAQAVGIDRLTWEELLK